MKEWGLTTPEGKKISFQRDTGLCNRMPYIDMHEHTEAFALLQTVCYDSSDNEDSDDEIEDAPGRPRPPLNRRSDDNDYTILVEDVLENDESLEDFEEEADVIQEPPRKGNAY